MGVWLLYGVVLGLQVFHRLGARRLALNAVLAFVLPVLTLLLLH
jgi:hypothetical protein